MTGFDTYENMLDFVNFNGQVKGDRTGTGTKSVFGMQARFNLADGFPMVTTKFVPLKLVAAELLWFLSGSTDNRKLQAMGCHIWDEWATSTGGLGPIYGEQWRSWGAKGQDQIKALIKGIKANPNSRRHIVSAWNVDVLPKESMSPQDNVLNGRMALAPCHAMFQFDVTPMSAQERFGEFAKANFGLDPSGGEIETARLMAATHDDGSGTNEFFDKAGIPRAKLSCQLYQRSADMFLGVPFNIASYSLLTHMVAQQCDLAVGDFIWVGGDCHIYSNHQEQVELQLSREPFACPMLNIKRKPDSIFDYKMEDFELVGYRYHPSIKAPIAI